MVNSPLREQPREKPAAVIPLKHESSLLDWLQSSGRLISRDNQELDVLVDEDDVSGLIEPDEITDDIFDDDDDIEFVEEE